MAADAPTRGTLKKRSWMKAPNTPDMKYNHRNFFSPRSFSHKGPNESNPIILKIRCVNPLWMNM
jgi:hypothetical protein